MTQTFRRHNGPRSRFRMLSLVSLLTLTLSGCWHYTTELTPVGIDNLMGSGKSLYAAEVTVHTKRETVSFAPDEWIGRDSTGTMLIGKRNFVETPDTIRMAEIMYITYATDIATVDEEGTKREWDQGDWVVLYENGQPVGLSSSVIGQTLLPKDRIHSITIVGSITIGTFLLWFWGLGILLFFGAIAANPHAITLK